MKKIFILSFITLFFASCSSRKMKLISISLMKTPTEGGIPLLMCFDNLDGINLDYDNHPTNGFWAEYTFITKSGKIYKEDASLGGWQNGNCLLINTALISNKGTSFEESEFYSQGVVLDSIKSIEISIFSNADNSEPICKKQFEVFGVLPENTDFN